MKAERGETIDGKFEISKVGSWNVRKEVQSEAESPDVEPAASYPEDSAKIIRAGSHTKQ